MLSQQLGVFLQDPEDILFLLFIDIELVFQHDEVLIHEHLESSLTSHLLVGADLGDAIMEEALEIITSLDCLVVIANHILSYEEDYCALIIPLYFVDAKYSRQKRVFFVHQMSVRVNYEFVVK